MSVYKWRLKDAKLNSRGLSSPWKTRHTPTENRLEEENRQRIQHPLLKKTCPFVLLSNHYVMLNLFQHLTASLYTPFLGEILKQVQDDFSGTSIE